VEKMWWLSCQNGWILAYVAYHEGKRASDHRADLVEAASVAVSDTANVLCDRALLNTTPRSDCIAERQAMRSIRRVIRSRARSRDEGWRGLCYDKHHVWVPGRNRTKTYGSELSTIFQILTAVLSAAFPKTMRGCKI
jgi:hypothetical protein